MVDLRQGKVVAPLLGVLAALAVGVAAVSYYMFMQERDHRIARERDLVIVRNENEQLQGQLSDAQELHAKMESELELARRSISESKEELTQALQTRDTLAKSVEDREKEITRLSKELEQSRTEAKGAADQLAELSQERDAIRQQMTELEEAKSQLETKVMELAERPTVELEKVVVGNEGAPGPAASGAAVRQVSATGGPQQGQVININREYDFIIVNLGQNHGLVVGQECQIVRDNQVLGRVKLEKVYDELSAAAILPDSQKDSIREGDLVRAL